MLQKAKLALSTVLLGCVSIVGVGQSKMDLTNAVLQSKEGAKSPKALLKALENLNKVAKNPDLNKTTKYLFTRGETYMYLASCPIAEVRDKGGDSAAIVAAEMFKRVLDIEDAFKDATKKEYTQFCYYNLMKNMPPILYNFGVLDFNAGRFDRAAKQFFFSAQFGKKDTNAHVNAVISGIKGKQDSIVYQGIMMASARGFADLGLYQAAIGYLQESPREVFFKDVLDSGRIKYPKDQAILNVELNYYLKRGEIDKILDKTEKAIRMNPDNAQYYFIKGTMLEEKAKETTNKAQRLAKRNQALESYKKAFGVDSNYIDAYLNAGVWYNNSIKGAIDTLNQLNNQINAQKTRAAQEPLLKKAKPYEAKIKEAYKKAIPLFEKVHVKDAKNKDALNALVFMYGFLNDEKKTLFYSDKIDALEKAQSGKK